MSGQMRSLRVAVTPVVSGGADAARAVLRSTAASTAFVAAMAAECTLHRYDGIVLEFAMGDFTGDDDAKLGALLRQLSKALGPRRSVAVAVPGARPGTELAAALRGSGVIVHVTQTTTAATGGELAAFDAAVGAAAAQFGAAQTSIGLSLRGWSAPTYVPSIVDVTTRLSSVVSHAIQQVNVDVDWSDRRYQGNQAVLDLWQLAFLAPFRTGAGMSWETFSPPRDGAPETRAAWGAAVGAWKETERARVGFDDPKSPYNDPGLNWTRRNFVSPQVMLHNRYLFDRASGNWTVDRWLQDVDLRYGGVDSVLLWHSYPNIGVDDRNQVRGWERGGGG